MSPLLVTMAGQLPLRYFLPWLPDTLRAMNISPDAQVDELLAADKMAKVSL